MNSINPKKVFFIKLGRGGEWNQECIDKKLKNYMEDGESNIVIWRLADISRYSINAGLIPWLINKAG